MFKYSTQNAKQTSEKVGVLDLIEATEGLNNAWMDLTEAQRNLDEVCQVMENIQQSLDLVARFGQSAVPVLNIDRSIENLLGIEEKLITAEKAQEGLGDAAKAAWEKIKEWCKKIWTAIRNAFSWLMQKIGVIFSKSGEAFDKLSKMSADEKKTLEETPIKISKKSTEGFDSLENNSFNTDLISGFGIISYTDLTVLATAQYNLVQNLLERCYYQHLLRKENIDKLMADINSGKTTVQEYIAHLENSMNDLVNDINSKCGKFYEVVQGVSGIISDWHVDWIYNMASTVNNISGDPKLKDIGWTASHISEVLRPGKFNELNERSTKKASDEFSKISDKIYWTLDKLQDECLLNDDDGVHRRATHATIAYYKGNLHLFGQFAKYNIKVTSLISETIAKLNGAILNSKAAPVIRTALDEGNYVEHDYGLHKKN